jgi:hypothetical protein
LYRFAESASFFDFFFGADIFSAEAIGLTISASSSSE